MRSEVEDVNFANEAGVFHTPTLLKNSTGLYLLQTMKKYLEDTGHTISWDEISKIAADKGLDVPLVDPNHVEIFKTRDMFSTLSKMTNSEDYEVIIASCYLSLVMCYRQACLDIERITGKIYKHIYIVGGGCRDSYANQLTADITGMTVHAGPAEAASIGNLALQLSSIYQGMDLQDIRQVIINSTNHECRVFVPNRIDEVLLEKKILEFNTITNCSR